MHTPAPHPYPVRLHAADIRNHAQAMVACDFCVAVTATFRLFDVFVVMEHATRQMLHVNVTAQPTAASTLRRLCELGITCGASCKHEYDITMRAVLICP